MDDYSDGEGGDWVPPDTTGIPSTSVPGDASGGLTGRDGLNMFNNLLGAWLKHDAQSMTRNQPMAYGQMGMNRPGVVTPQQQQNRNMLLMIGLAAVVVIAVKD